MRSKDIQNTAMWSYVSPEQCAPADHPLRSIREMANGALRSLSPDFAKLLSKQGPTVDSARAAAAGAALGGALHGS
jgi:hypothetical protein